MMIKYLPKKCPDAMKCRSVSCTQLNKATKYICAYPFNERMVEVIKKWNKLTKKRKQLNEYHLSGIKYWTVSYFELHPNYDASEDMKRAVEEGVTLLKEGFTLGYNTETGIGSLIRDTSIKVTKYNISAWCHQIHRIDKLNMDAEEAVYWIITRHNR